MSSIYLKNGKKSCISPIIKDEEIMNIFSDIINNIDIDKYKIINTLNLLYNTKDNFKNKITKEIDGKVYMIPNDKRTPKETSGVRIGIAPMTTRGYKEEDFVKVVHRIDELIKKLREEYK